MPCQLLPGRSFVVGCDTAIRIVNPVYYEEQKVENMVKALMGIYRDGGCAFRSNLFAQRSSHCVAALLPRWPPLPLLPLLVPDAFQLRPPQSHVLGLVGFVDARMRES